MKSLMVRVGVILIGLSIFVYKEGKGEMKTKIERGN